jgi:hypothetical protein
MLTSIPQAFRLYLSAGSTGFGIKEEQNFFPFKSGKGNFFVILV